MKNIKEKTSQDWIPIEEIFENGIIKINKNKYIKILKIIPINYNLKSDLEKSSILNSYKILLKTCNFNFQILIQSNKEDLSKNISNIKQNLKNKNERFLKELAEDYISYISEINLNEKSSSKNFYIIISNDDIKNNNEEIIISELNEKFFKIKECLSRCGNVVNEYTSKNELISDIYSFLNYRKSNSI